MKDDSWKAQETILEVDSYNRWYYSAIKQFLGRRVLDIGSGMGCLFQHFFESPAELLVGADASAGNLQRLKERFKDRNVQTDFIHLDITGELPLDKLRAYNFDTIVCTSVLEHIKDDTAALKNMHAILKKGTKVLLIVPAYSFLYGYLDKAAEHYRRYSRREIEGKIKAAGLRVIHTSFINVPGIIVWKIVNLLFAYKRRVKTHFDDPQKFIAIFKVVNFFNPLLNLYARMELKWKPAFGLCIVCVAERTGD